MSLLTQRLSYVQLETSLTKPTRPILCLLPILILLSVGCGQKEKRFLTGDPLVDSLAPLNCGQGTQYQAGRNAEYIEQWCQSPRGMHGPYHRRTLTGILIIEGEYLLGHAQAKWTWYHETESTPRKVSSRGFYKKGKPTSTWSWWSASGALIQEGEFYAGKKTGTWIQWHENGRKSEEGQYVNGLQEGTWSYYDDTGSSTKQESWARGVQKESS